MNVGRWFGRRTWAEPLYIVASAPLAAVGWCYVLASLLLSGVLSATAVGVPLLALSLYGARRLGGLQRAVAHRLLGEGFAGPGPPRPASGLFDRVQSMLSDVPAWRAMAFLMLQAPLVFLQTYVVACTWGWGLIGLTYPIQHALGVNDVAAFDPLPRQPLVCLAGLSLVLAAPWAVQGATLPSRMLLRWLLGPYGSAERIRHLQETRAQVVDDAAATLRRIERDLHDGAQARLIALTMQLTMVREAVPAGPARDLAIQAQTMAHEAITELRELVRGIHPPVLDQGLETALASLAARSPVPVDLRVSEAERPTAAIESIAYFCAAELLTNVARHSGSDRAHLEITQGSGHLRLRVGDSGRGGAQVGAGSGLAGLLDRVRAVDGSLTVDSPPGGPTVVTVELPTHA